ncbi:MAG: chromosome segregation protein SMC [Actinobacteria bacterium]|nr:MAG: chromosome segregation protein SMC [Actinomycetota bacterium]
MFLKSLTLKGFKSFAETTILEFEPGVTVVVGPNGSGKSNIVDAVAWVLGAQGPSTVRSSKMEDVIFAGSSKRPALGRAEVTLTIDNSSHLLPIDFTEVTLTRTLFRSSGESEYAINGVTCRLLDIQELLSDSGVGRTQHVIVSQGQLDAVLNARPEDRRTVIEEAAGVLKYRRRKEKAERRLEGTEANLVRLQDLLREVRRQLRPLERQAEAARRHGEVAAELGALQLYLAGREVAGLRARATAAAAARAGLTEAEMGVKARLARLDADVVATEAALSAAGGDELGDALARVEALRERARGLAALLAERRRSAERERAASLASDVVAALEAEGSRLRTELAAVGAEAATLTPRADELARAESGLADERAAFEDQWGNGVAMAGGEAAEVRGELSARRAGLESGRTEMARLEARLAGLEQRAGRLDADAARLRGEIEEADIAERALAAAAERATARRTEADTARAEAESGLRGVEAERQAWASRADGLALAVESGGRAGGAEHLTELEGVVGALSELLQVDPGWEQAVQAALGDALAAVVVVSPYVARRAVAALAEGGVAGVVLALGGATASSSSRGLAPEPHAMGRDPGAKSEVGVGRGRARVRDHVRSAHADVGQLLDALLAGAVAVDDLAEAVDVVLQHPDAVVVTRAGDRFSAAGWRVGRGAVGTVEAALDEARGRAADAGAQCLAAEHRLRDATDALVAARSAEAERVRTLHANDERLTAAADALQRLEAERAQVGTEDDTLRMHLGELAERVAREQARVTELEAKLPELEAEESAGAQRVAAMRSARERLDQRAAAVSALRTDLEVRAAGLEERRMFLSRRLAEVEERLTVDAAERASARTRREQVELLLTRTDRLAAVVADRLALLEGELTDLRERRRRQSEAARALATRLDGLRRDRSAAERELEELRERSRRAELEDAEVRMRLEAAVETVRRDFDREPEAAEAAEAPPLAPGTNPVDRARELERDLRLMGPVNPLALEEYTSLQERHAFLEDQLDDVKSSRRELAKVIRAVDAEIVEVFRAAYADVAENYERLFETLFPGGAGRLRLTDSENLLETGIELEARPPGKNVRKLSLLSGGERSLTALAFLFAVFRSRPSPFYLLDEVEAALDDVNLHRFLDLVHEFREEAQLLIVSHQKRTMEAADSLYGVTMQPGGSSKVISERVRTTA